LEIPSQSRVLADEEACNRDKDYHPLIHIYMTGISWIPVTSDLYDNLLALVGRTTLT
jgi:hypothetical protein